MTVSAESELYVVSGDGGGFIYNVNSNIHFVLTLNEQQAKACCLIALHKASNFDFCTSEPANWHIVIAIDV